MLASIKNLIIVVFKAFAITSILIVMFAIGYKGYKYFHPPLVSKAASHDDKKLSPVVRLTNQAGRTFCSGVVVNQHTVITAGHCVLEEVSFLGVPINSINTEIYVRDSAASIIGIKATVSSVRIQSDQATLEGDFSIFEPRAVITDITKIVEVEQPGATFISCGYPLGGDLYCSRFKYVGRINFMWLGTGTLLPGMSGGPTMLQDGTVVAINDAVEGEFSVVSPTFNTPLDKLIYLFYF